MFSARNWQTGLGGQALSNPVTRRVQRLCLTPIVSEQVRRDYPPLFTSGSIFSLSPQELVFVGLKMKIPEWSTEWVSEWASEARGWQGFKDWLVIASTCFPTEWFWNWQFQILSLDKSSDCSGIAKVEAHIGRNAICPGYVTFYRNSLFAAEICQNESIFSHITTWAPFRDKYSWWLERLGRWPVLWDKSCLLLWWIIPLWEWKGKINPTTSRSKTWLEKSNRQQSKLGGARGKVLASVTDVEMSDINIVSTISAGMIWPWWRKAESWWVVQGSSNLTSPWIWRQSCRRAYWRGRLQMRIDCCRWLKARCRRCTKAWSASLTQGRMHWAWKRTQPGCRTQASSIKT